jgi:hypothetical protein
VKRREVLRQLELMVEPGTSLGQDPEVFCPIDLQGLAQQDYPATQVLLTLETEAAQRLILSTLCVGAVDVARQKSPYVKKNCEKKLDVAEPYGFSTLRWQDLNEKWKDCATQQWLTMVRTISANFTIAHFGLHSQSTFRSSCRLRPRHFQQHLSYVKMLTDIGSHSSEVGKQRSLYMKDFCLLSLVSCVWQQSGFDPNQQQQQHQ